MKRRRIILHIDMDYFFAQIEERENPQFKGKPVVVGADPKGGEGRGVVSTANYKARKYGIHSALPISKAYELCPEAIFLPVNMELYEKVFENIMNIIKKYSPKWEIVSLDEAYLDLSFLKSYQNAEDLAKKLKKEIFEKEKLTSTVGIGPNKLIAKMAAKKAKPGSRILTGSAEGGTEIGKALSKFHYRAKPDGLLIIKPNQVKNFLELLDIEDLPGIGPKTGVRIRQSLSLASPQIRSREFRGPRISSEHYLAAPVRIKDLKRLSKRELIELLGVVGERIYERARGIDEQELTSEEIIKSVGKEYTFERDTRDPEIIFKAFEKIIKDVHYELTSNRFSFKTITVICRFTGFETHTKSKTLKKSTSDLEVLKKESKKLLLKFLIENPKLIRLIGLRVKIC